MARCKFHILGSFANFMVTCRFGVPIWRVHTYYLLFFTAMIVFFCVIRYFMQLTESDIHLLVRFHLSIFRTHNYHTLHLVRHLNSISLYSIAPQLQRWLFLNRTAIQPSQQVLTIIFETLRPNKTSDFFYVSKPIHLIDRYKRVRLLLPI